MENKLDAAILQHLQTTLSVTVANQSLVVHKFWFIELVWLNRLEKMNVPWWCNCIHKHQSFRRSQGNSIKTRMIGLLYDNNMSTLIGRHYSKYNLSCSYRTDSCLSRYLLYQLFQCMHVLYIILLHKHNALYTLSVLYSFSLQIDLSVSSCVLAYVFICHICWGGPTANQHRFGPDQSLSIDRRQGGDGDGTAHQSMDPGTSETNKK